ncbi:MAG TPA: hypothetical protein PKC60_06940 [Hydrogenophaga sp.]|uniref:hypothetical protein n=1 Tax=Hydrogenophaga sp. TaxID=1904254 RepID=UPI002CFFA485|nr:hypothetical protein [Hydrogenophaga sp.]HMN92949.1 hypothetical protein [Hydrogenophaga sp.]HMP09748.1 hypothetical protein [Hydrogenophaga sp.]
MTDHPAKADRKKPKLVRDSFTIPKGEYAAIDLLKTRAVALGTSVKKSELLRAGLLALQGMNDAGFKQAIAAVPQLKTGRPAATTVEASPPAPQAPAQRSSPRPAPARARTAKPAKPAEAKAPVPPAPHSSRRRKPTT